MTPKMTRKQLAAMTDEEIVARYRHKHGNPYMPLSLAKEMCRVELKYWHLGALAARRAEEDGAEQLRGLRAQQG